MTEPKGGMLSDADKLAVLDRVEERASFYMNKFGGCGQCSLRALQEELALPGGPAALKAAGFTNMGIAVTGTICGAFLGGIMAMGLACGREDLADPVYPEPMLVDDVYMLPKSLLQIRSFYQKFLQEFGSLSCLALQVRVFGRSFDIMDIDEEEQFQLAGGHTKCVGIVGKAARMAAQVILELPRR